MSDPDRGVARNAPVSLHESESDDGARFSYAVAALQRSIFRSMGAVLAPFGLTVAEYTALSLIRRRDGYSNAQLARRSFVSPQAMHELSISLESRGLLDRAQSSFHRSIRHTHLSQKGRELLERCDTAVDVMEEAMIADLGLDERSEMISFLMRAARRLRELPNSK